MPNAVVYGNTSAVAMNDWRPSCVLGTQLEYPIHGQISGRNSRLICKVAGGSRRDQAKLVARTQHRRARHMKGLKPSKPWILKELEEEDTEDELQQVDQSDVGDGSFADKEKMLNQWDLSVPHQDSITHQGSIPSGRPENNMSTEGSGIMATTEGNGASNELKELNTGGEKGGKQW